MLQRTMRRTLFFTDMRHLHDAIKSLKPFLSLADDLQGYRATKSLSDCLLLVRY
jgi:hypothetical protein